jgi:hypothetical protein
LDDGYLGHRGFLVAEKVYAAAARGARAASAVFLSDDDGDTGARAQGRRTRFTYKDIQTCRYVPTCEPLTGLCVEDSLGAAGEVPERP